MPAGSRSRSRERVDDAGDAEPRDRSPINWDAMIDSDGNSGPAVSRDTINDDNSDASAGKRQCLCDLRDADPAAYHDFASTVPVTYPASKAQR